MPTKKQELSLYFYIVSMSTIATLPSPEKYPSYIPAKRQQSCLKYHLTSSL